VAGQEAKGRRRGNNQEEKEEEGREDMGALVQWFHDRWHGLTEGVKAKRQMGRHVDRRAQACREKAELVRRQTATPLAKTHAFHGSGKL
jgi:hypothetical protein